MILRTAPLPGQCAAEMKDTITRYHTLLSKALRPIWKESETCCENAEEILAETKEINEKEIEGDLYVGSLDVKALYPSLDKDLPPKRSPKNSFKERI